MSEHQSNHCNASADRIRDALFDLYADCEQVPETLIIYALCDLRHLCDAQDVKFSAADKRAHAHYLEERQESTP